MSKVLEVRCEDQNQLTRRSAGRYNRYKRKRLPDFLDARGRLSNRNLVFRRQPCANRSAVSVGKIAPYFVVNEHDVLIIHGTAQLCPIES